MTHLAHGIERSHSFFFLIFFLFPNDKVKQLPVATVRKFDFFPVAFFAGKERFWLFSTDQHRERIRRPAPRSLAKCMWSSNMF